MATTPVSAATEMELDMYLNTTWNTMRRNEYTGEPKDCTKEKVGDK